VKKNGGGEEGGTKGERERKTICKKNLSGI
jgi:hypothetical protein